MIRKKPYSIPPDGLEDGVGEKKKVIILVNSYRKH
jgi:hypothetical protein